MSPRTTSLPSHRPTRSRPAGQAHRRRHRAEVPRVRRRRIWLAVRRPTADRWARADGDDCRTRRETHLCTFAIDLGWAAAGSCTTNVDPMGDARATRRLDDQLDVMLDMRR